MNSKKYEELKVIGMGGQGTVYKVKKRSDRTIYALKVIDVPKVQKSKQKKKIDTEIASLTSLKHPGIVKVYSIEQNENTLDIEMDYVEGLTLQESINKGVENYKEGIDIMLQILQPMIYLHNKNISHLDIKPQNIILDGNNKPIIVDFGSSFLLHSGKELYTMTDSLKGSSGYVAPEILIGKKNSKFNPKLADIYSLGATLYTILTQKVIYDTLDIYSHIKSIVNKERIIAPHKINKAINKNLSQLCMQALAYEPKKRISSCEKFYDQLKLVADSESTDISNFPFVFKKIIIGSSLIPIIFGSYLLVSTYERESLDAQDYFNIALKYEQGSPRPDYKKSLEYYMKATEKGSKNTFIKIGDLYNKGGYGIEKNYDQAIMWYKKSAKYGDVAAMLNIGYLYGEGGYGVEKDYLECLEWYSKVLQTEDSMKFTIEDKINELYKRIAFRHSKTETIEWYRKIEQKGYKSVSSYLEILLKNDNPPKNSEKILDHSKSSVENNQNTSPEGSGKSVDYYIKLFQNGDINAISKIREIYNEEKNKVHINYKQSFDLHKKFLPFLDMKGKSEANISIGLLYFKGDKTIGMNRSTAEKYYKKALEQGNDYVFIHLGKLYSAGGHGVEIDLNKAEECYIKASKNKELEQESYFELGQLKQKHYSKQSPDYAKAIEYYQKSFEAGNISALINIGYLHQYGGYGVERNQEKAFTFYKRAVDKGNADAMLSIAKMYNYGSIKHPTNSKESEALKWYIKSAEAGSESGIITLAHIYRGGNLGVDKSYSKALKLFLMIKENQTARFYIAQIYRDGGYGVERNYKEALVYYNKMLKENNYNAMVEIANVYKKGGYGVKKDYSRALELYNKAFNSVHFSNKQIKKDINSSIGDIYFKGDDTLEKNWETAVKYYKKNKYPNTSIITTLNLIEMYYKGGYNLEKSKEEVLYAYTIFNLFDKSKLTQDEEDRIQNLKVILDELSNS